MEHDLRNLPAAVIARLADVGVDLGIQHKGRIIEAGDDQRGRLDAVQLELREGADGSVTLDGYATVYDVWYDVAGGPAKGGWREQIAAGAAAKSIAERDDVFLLFDHDGLPIARTGIDLVLTSDKIGLRSEATPDMSSSWNSEIVSRIRSGLIDSMSFAFRAVRQEWNDDYTERIITEVQLFDVSAVKWPANPVTAIQARDDEQIDETRGMDLALAQAYADQARRRCPA